MSDNKKSEEQQFTIQPHPATTNNPADLQGEPATHGGLQSSKYETFNTPETHIPSKEIVDGLEQPKSREELKAAAAELNK